MAESYPGRNCFHGACVSSMGLEGGGRGFSPCFSLEGLASLPSPRQNGGHSTLRRVTPGRIDDSVTYGCF